MNLNQIQQQVQQMPKLALDAYKASLRSSERQRAIMVENAIRRAASRQMEANRNGQRDMGAQKQDQESTASASGDTYRIGRTPSILDRCISNAANVEEEQEG